MQKSRFTIHQLEGILRIRNKYACLKKKNPGNRDEDLSNKKKKKKVLSEKKKSPAEGCRRNVEEGERSMNFPAEQWKQLSLVL